MNISVIASLRRQKTGVAALLAMCAASLGATGGIAQTPLNDRRSIIQTATTDDPQRIPVKESTAAKAVTVLVGGLVFDAKSARSAPATVLIEGNKIAAIWPAGRRDWPADARVINVGGKTVLPGLIDLHVHLTYPDSTTPIDLQASEGDGVLRGARTCAGCWKPASRRFAI